MPKRDNSTPTSSSPASVKPKVKSKSTAKVATRSPTPYPHLALCKPRAYTPTSSTSTPSRNTTSKAPKSQGKVNMNVDYGTLGARLMTSPQPTTNTPTRTPSTRLPNNLARRPSTRYRVPGGVRTQEPPTRPTPRSLRVVNSSENLAPSFSAATAEEQEVPDDASSICSYDYDKANFSDEGDGGVVFNDGWGWDSDVTVVEMKAHPWQSRDVGAERRVRRDTVVADRNKGLTEEWCLVDTPEPEALDEGW